MLKDIDHVGGIVQTLCPGVRENSRLSVSYTTGSTYHRRAGGEGI